MVVAKSMDRPGGVDVVPSNMMKRNEDEAIPIDIALGRVDHILEKKKNSKKKMA